MRVSLIVCFAILVVAFYQALRSAIAEVEREELVGEKNTLEEKNIPEETKINSYEMIVGSSMVRNTGDNWVSWEIVVKKMTKGKIWG